MATATEYQDYPFEEVRRQADERIAMGATVFQKFTCAGCGARLTMETPNTFHEYGSCDRCNVLTNIRQRGCNYMALLDIPVVRKL
ncbi:hypothetical protein [Bradyrhizobium elkanii]|uniref:hypothetical protein n=1 Tax=Bradyrhizobium elkanii TaxID=29448 RepID=UPI0004820524|nr:hypothetical protein [Bradyrhizobium elkanii]